MEATPIGASSVERQLAGNRPKLSWLTKAGVRDSNGVQRSRQRLAPEREEALQYWEFRRCIGSSAKRMSAVAKGDRGGDRVCAPLSARNHVVGW